MISVKLIKMFIQTTLNRSIHIVCCALTGSLSTLTAQENNTAEIENDDITDTKNAISKIIKINEFEYKIGEILINKKTRTISFEAEAEITESEQLLEVDHLEYILVNEQGKVHEALFVTDVRPIHLNIAFKLLGYKENKSIFRIFNGNFPTNEYHKTPEDLKAKSYFATNVSWTESDSKESVNYDLNDLLYNGTTKKTFKEENILWSYGGSFLHQGQFAADINSNLISILTDRSSIANFIGKNGEQGDLWLPITTKLPKKGTKVSIRITPSFPAK